jgi:hypothetical protein
MKYLAIQEIQCVGPGSSEQDIDQLTEALLDLEVVDDSMTDPDLVADVSTGRLDIQMIIDAADPAEATIKALAMLSAAIQAVGDACLEKAGHVSDQDDALIPRPSFTLPALRQAVAVVAPGRLPEMFTKMQEAFVRVGERDSVTPIRMFYREWAVVVEIERHPEIARRLHTAEQALMSDDPQIRDAAIHDAGEIVRAAHRAVAGERLARP